MPRTRKTRDSTKDSKGSKKFLKGAIRHPGRVREDQKRLFGSKAFNQDGDLNRRYLKLGKEHFEREGNTSAVDAYDLAETLTSKGFRVNDVHYGSEE